MNKPKINCIVCDKDINRLGEYHKNLEFYQQNYDDALVDVICCGYGSGLDGDMYVISICDDCIRQKCNEGKLLYIGDTMCETFSKRYNLKKELIK